MGAALELPPQSPPPPPPPPLASSVHTLDPPPAHALDQDDDDVDVTGIYAEGAAVEEISTSVSSGKKWTVGDCTISRGLVEFLFPATGILILLITALVGVFNDPTNPIYAQLLFLVAGVLTPNPKLNADTNHSKGNSSNFINRHYIEHGGTTTGR